MNEHDHIEGKETTLYPFGAKERKRRLILARIRPKNEIKKAAVGAEFATPVLAVAKTKYNKSHHNRKQ